MTQQTPRAPYIIAQEIQKEMPRSGSAWTFTRPYVEAMRAMEDWQTPYGADSASSVGLYFLCNAGNWRGAAARRIKAEIKAACQGDK